MNSTTSVNLSDSLPTLPRAIVFKNTTPEEQSISFKCFCCNDTGWVQQSLILKIIPDYDDKTDKFIICRRLPSCTAKVPICIIEQNMYDERFNNNLLNQLNKLGMQYWQDTINNQRHFVNASLINEFCHSAFTT